MANYTNMVSSNQKKSREMETLAIGTIKEMLEDGEKVTVAELVKRTGCCRAYFYTNEEVRKALEFAREEQTGKVFIKPQKTILDNAIAHENEILKLRVTSLQLKLEAEIAKNTKRSDEEFDLISQL